MWLVPYTFMVDAAIFVLVAYTGWIIYCLFSSEDEGKK